MKTILLLLTLAIACSPVFAADLIYKGSLSADSDLGRTTPIINTVAYKQLRIYAAHKSGYAGINRDSSVVVWAVEANQMIFPWTFDAMKMRESILIDTPPSAIQIHILGKGQFVVYVWAS